MSRNWLAAVLLAFAPACRTGHDLARADITSYNQLTSDLSAQVQAYRSTASSMLSPSDCTAALQHYLTRVRPDVAGMGPLASRIDDHMMGMGGMMAGDMRCGMDVISRELDRHGAVACTSADMEANRAEALRHCDQMQGYADHMRMRGAEAGEMMGSGMMGSGMTNCCGPHSDGGWTMADGGTMGWDHQMPGCSTADGG